MSPLRDAALEAARALEALRGVRFADLESGTVAAHRALVALHLELSIAGRHEEAVEALVIARQIKGLQVTDTDLCGWAWRCRVGADALATTRSLFEVEPAEVCA